MATSSKKASSIVCPSCGVTNSPIPPSGRCVSCGSSMEALRGHGGEGDEHGRRGSEGFSLVWAGIALLVQAVLTAAIVMGLPMVVSALDFEGRYGMMIAVPVWFVGGVLLGMISPGKTVAEPVVATLLVAIPTVLQLMKSQTVRTLPLFMYVILAAIGVLFTMVGSYLGERIQMGPPPKRAGAD
jgi:hypothetical protein